MTLRRRSLQLVLWMVATCASIMLTSSTSAAKENGGVSIEWAYLATYPEADCTKIHVYVKNTGKFPAFLEGIHLGDKFLDLDLDRQDALNLAEASVGGAEADHMAHDERAGTFSRSPGSLQWHRALPNPVEPGCICDVTVSLWGVVKDAAIRIPVRGCGELRWDAKETPRALRLSHIAFDPGDPNKIYVYCENKTDKDIAIHHILVDTEKVDVTKSIPIGNTIEAGKKTCFIVRPKQKMIWGRYAGVGVVGKSGEKVVAVVRVINYFPIGSWSVDTRKEMFFDSVDLRKPMPNRGPDATFPNAMSVTTTPVQMTNARPSQAYYDGRDPTCEPHSWETSAQDILHSMATCLAVDPLLPYYTHICQAGPLSYSFFGELPDIVLVNPYRLNYRPVSPGKNADLVALSRTWADPRIVVAVPETFRTEGSRDILPNEIIFQVWGEISEGAKGVRYFTRRCTGGAGYDQMPGVDTAISRMNLDLQIVKPFLRIGDTFDFARADNASVRCRSILCGGDGIICVVFNDNYTVGAKTPTTWQSTRSVKISVALPRGVDAGMLYRLSGGVAAHSYVRKEEHFTFEIPQLETVAVFLLHCSSPIDAVVGPGVCRSAQDTDVMSAKAILEAYNSATLQYVSPLTSTGSDPTKTTALLIGRGIAEAREYCLSQLLRMENNATRQEEHTLKHLALVAGLAEAYLLLGEPQRASQFVDTCCRRAPSDAAASCFVAFGRRCLASGQYSEAATAMLRAYELSANPCLRNRVSREMSDVYEQQLHDYDAAIAWAQKELDYPAEAEGTVPSLQRRFHLASLLLAAGRTTDAISHLNALPESCHATFPVDYMLGLAYAGAGMKEHAVKHLQHAVVSKQGPMGEIRFMLGSLWHEMGLDNDARRELEMALPILGNGPRAKRAQTLLSLIRQREGR